MKRNFLFMSVLASMFLVGCSQEVITQNGETDGNGKGETHYLSVNIMSSDGGTRATSDGYEDGTTDENKVTSIRFYFFDDNGNPAYVKLNNQNQYVNYYNWDPKKSNSETEGDQSEDTEENDVESKLKATIVINTQSGDKIPQKMVAVVNPSTEILGSGTQGSKSLNDLKNIYRDYAAPALTNDKGTFVMFNSVYAANNAQVSTTAITAENLQKTEDLAKNHPVTIYVERSVAKVRVTLGGATTDIGADFDPENSLIALKDQTGNSLLVGTDQVYLKINGWKLTAETSQGRLVKKIDPENWTENNWWNIGYRTCWAINAPTTAPTNNKNQYNTYSSLTGFPQHLYTNENAADYSSTAPLKRTKVILSGTLLYKSEEDGETKLLPFTIVRHMGKYFAAESSSDESQNLVALKTSILDQLTSNGCNYRYKTTGTVDGVSQAVYEPITENDLKIVAATQKPQEDSKNNCYVYAQLTDGAKDKEWYYSDEKGEVKSLGDKTTAANIINSKLKDDKLKSGTETKGGVVDRALVWKEGMTYYYYEIIHNGTGANATKGVVRNHIYDTKVTSIAGLGTPVYNPNEVIYPEKPDPNDHYIAAQINILAWHIVSNDYELEW